MNREATNYPKFVVSNSDPKYVEEYNGMILFNVNISEYRDLISKNLNKVFDTYHLGMQESGEATPKDLLK